MKKGMLVFAVASGLALVVSSNVFAGNRPGAVTITPGVGVDFFAKKRNFTNTSVLPELALTYNFDDRWGIEGSYNTFGTSHRHVTVKGDLYLIDGIYRLNHTYTWFEPYVTGGVGVYHLNPNGTNSTNQGNINLGVGTQFFFSPSMAFRLEGRDLYTFVGGKNDQMINFGMSILIGGQTPAPAATASYKGEAPATRPAITDATTPAMTGATPATQTPPATKVSTPIIPTKS